MDPSSSTYWQSLQRLDAWLVKQEYKAYDPFDGLSSFLRPLALGMNFPQRVLQQVVRRNPFNLRPLIGIKPHTSTKGMGYLAASYVKLFHLTNDEQYRQRAVSCYQWLIDHASKGYSGYCWGNAFDYVSRGSFIPKGAPTVVWSGLIGHHFMEGYRALGDRRYLDVVKGVGDFIMNDLPRITTPSGTCISYVTDQPLAVHNSNLIGARLLAELYKETGDKKYLNLATDAVHYSTVSQLKNGAWYYGEDKKFQWIDNWHTAYNLDCILDFERNTGSEAFHACLLKGLDFYVNNFFRADGAPKYYWDRDYKFDIQSASQSIDTLALFGGALHRQDLTDLAQKVARWTIANMQDEKGFFYLWKNTWWTNRTPTFHWGGTTMMHALAHLLLEVKRSEH